MSVFGGKYRIPSSRLQSWDYRRPAAYFVTICTRNKLCCLGEVVEGEVALSSIGRIVVEEWQKTPCLRANITLDEWQVMPNHLHGIVIIKDVATARRAVSGRDAPAERLYDHPPDASQVETARRAVSTAPRLRSGSLGSIVGQFKSASTKRIREAGFRDFAWQARFYDHIIRNQDSLEKIRDYIRHNPVMWPADENTIENLFCR